MSDLSGLRSLHSCLVRNKVFLVIYYLSIAAILIGFLYSRALLSIGQIAMAANYLLEGDYKRKIHALSRNWIAYVLAGLYVVHVIFLINTEDFAYAAKDLRIKLPMLLFPIVLASTNFIKGLRMKYVAFSFVALVFSGTLVIWVNYLVHSNDIQDMREASFLISHIRFALMICLGIAINIYFSTKTRIKTTLLLTALNIYFLIYMVQFAYITGLAILAILLLFMMVYYLRRSRMHLVVKRTIVVLMSTMFMALSAFIVVSAMDYLRFHEKKNVTDLEQTPSGRPYHQWYRDYGYEIRENGYLVYQNVAFEELKQEWNKRSTMDFDYLDGKLQDHEDILLRFLSSKGLPKDSVAISMLSQSEVSAIENGITNVNYMNRSNLYRRLFNLYWQIDTYFSGGNFNEHSLGMRLEFWKTGIHVIERFFWFGTGTGDINMEFQRQYTIDDSKLLPELRYRSHNQAITFWAAFGIFGFLYFLVVLFLPLRFAKNNFLYLSFFLIFFLSILAEDTIETQIGVSFYTFFNSLLLFYKRV